MFLNSLQSDLCSVEDQLNDHSSESVPELSEVYLEMERTRALHLDVSDLILSSSGYARREWVRLGRPDEPAKP